MRAMLLARMLGAREAEVAQEARAENLLLGSKTRTGITAQVGVVAPFLPWPSTRATPLLSARGACARAAAVAQDGDEGAAMMRADLLMSNKKKFAVAAGNVAKVVKRRELNKGEGLLAAVMGATEAHARQGDAEEEAAAEWSDDGAEEGAATTGESAHEGEGDEGEEQAGEGAAGGSGEDDESTRRERRQSYEEEMQGPTGRGELTQYDRGGQIKAMDVLRSRGVSKTGAALGELTWQTWWKRWSKALVEQEVAAGREATPVRLWMEELGMKDGAPMPPARDVVASIRERAGPLALPMLVLLANLIGYPNAPPIQRTTALGVADTAALAEHAKANNVPCVLSSALSLALFSLCCTTRHTHTHSTHARADGERVRERQAAGGGGVPGRTRLLAGGAHSSHSVLLARRWAAAQPLRRARVQPAAAAAV